MIVTVNGAERELPDGTSVAELLGGAPRGRAVVVDDEVVPRSEWPVSTLRAGARIELITAVQGG